MQFFPLPQESLLLSPGLLVSFPDLNVCSSPQVLGHDVDLYADDGVHEAPCEDPPHPQPTERRAVAGEWGHTAGSTLSGGSRVWLHDRGGSTAAAIWLHEGSGNKQAVGSTVIQGSRVWPDNRGGSSQGWMVPMPGKH